MAPAQTLSPPTENLHRMRIIFFGTASFAVPSLERLSGTRHSIVLCVTQPDRPRGRGLKQESSPVKEAALRLSIPIAQPERLSRQALGSVEADVGIVAAYGQLIRRDVLEFPAHGLLGIHPSILPRYRGAAPVAWAILNGEKETGLSIYRLDERLDAGEVLRVSQIPIEPGDTTSTLTDKLARLGADEIVKALEDLEAGRANSRKQDESLATLAPKFSKEEGQIDWSQESSRITRQVRALNPWPGAVTSLDGTRIKLYDVESLPGKTQGSPGRILLFSSEGIDVSTGQGIVRIHALQAAGSRRMTAGEFLAGHKLRADSRLEPPKES